MKNEIPVAAFDHGAHTYDSDFSYTQIGMLQRKRVHQILSPLLVADRPLKVLEINCGTGEDAIWMAKKGHEVIGIDISSMMIEQANRKIDKHPEKLNLNFFTSSFSELKNYFADESFDLIFSDFGGLNCIPSPEFTRLTDNMAGMLKPGGKFAGVLMGRKCIWEIFYFLLKGNTNAAFRRLSNNAVMANMGQSNLPVWYYSPQAVREFFSGKLSFTGLKPVGFCIPPSYLENYFTPRKKSLNNLARAEQLFDFSIFADYADHYFISFEKK